MGVNMVGNCIIDDEVCREASYMEILRRYYTALTDRLQGKADDELVFKLELLMKQAGHHPGYFPRRGGLPQAGAGDRRSRRGHGAA